MKVRLKYFKLLFIIFDRPVSLVVKGTAVGAGGLGFNFRAGQIGHSVANGSPPLRCFFRAVLLRRLAVEMDPATRCKFRRNTASIIKL